VYPDFLSCIEIRRTKVKPCRVQINKIYIYMFVLFLFVIFIHLIIIYCYDFYKHVFVCFVFYICLSLVSLLLLLFGKKMIFFKTTLIFIYLIKGTVLGRALWGANTFPTRNRFPSPYFGLQTILSFWFFHGFH